MNKKYDGRAQFNESLDSINKWINEARTGIYIYTELTREGKMTLSYNHFQRYLAEYKNNEIKKIKNDFFKIYNKKTKDDARLSDEDQVRIKILERMDLAIKEINRRHHSGVEKKCKKEFSGI